MFTDKRSDFRNVRRIGQKSWMAFHSILPIVSLVESKLTMIERSIGHGHLSSGVVFRGLDGGDLRS
jgi:hypothetical protein